MGVIPTTYKSWMILQVQEPICRTENVGVKSSTCLFFSFPFLLRKSHTIFPVKKAPPTEKWPISLEALSIDPLVVLQPIPKSLAKFECNFCWWSPPQQKKDRFQNFTVHKFVPKNPLVITPETNVLNSPKKGALCAQCFSNISVKTASTKGWPMKGRNSGGVQACK